MDIAQWVEVIFVGLLAAAVAWASGKPSHW